jgi:hypothetical protein
MLSIQNCDLLSSSLVSRVITSHEEAKIDLFNVLVKHRWRLAYHKRSRRQVTRVIGIRIAKLCSMEYVLILKLWKCVLPGHTLDMYSNYSNIIYYYTSYSRYSNTRIEHFIDWVLLTNQASVSAHSLNRLQRDMRCTHLYALILDMKNMISTVILKNRVIGRGLR